MGVWHFFWVGGAMSIPRTLQVKRVGHKTCMERYSELCTVDWNFFETWNLNRTFQIISEKALKGHEVCSLYTGFWHLFRWWNISRTLQVRKSVKRR
jgi:hypothetical protein